MAIIKFYDAMGQGASMAANPDFVSASNDGSTTVDGDPYVSSYDYDTVAATYSYNGGSLYATAFVSEISDPYYLLESVYYADSDINPLADFYGINLTFNANDDFSSGVTFVNMLAGNDTVSGNSYSDYLSAGGGYDEVWGYAGNDTLDGGSGSDTLLGGAGNDTYVVGSTSDRVYETTTIGGTINAGGTDTVRSSVSYTLGSFVESLTLTGTAAINGTGNTLANSLIGNAAANLLNGGSGADKMLGGAGSDTYYVDNTGDRVYETTTIGGTINAGGTDTVRSSVSYALGSFVENLTLTGTAAINGTGNTLANSLTGNAAANVLNGGSGADSMLGAAGSDTYYVDNAGDKVYETTTTSGTTNAGGTDKINSSITFSLASYTGVSFVESLTLTGTAAINGTGNTLANSLTGNGAANTLAGGAGNDVLNGGAGKDVLIGGTGLDTFRFTSSLSASSNVDRISDFKAIDDRIDLDDAVFHGIGPVGALSSTAFRVGKAAADSSDHVIYDSSTGNLLFDADGSGSGSAVLFATVTAGTQVTAADFFVV